MHMASYGNEYEYIFSDSMPTVITYVKRKQTEKILIYIFDNINQSKIFYIIKLTSSIKHIRYGNTNLLKFIKF